MPLVALLVGNEAFSRVLTVGWSGDIGIKWRSPRFGSGVGIVMAGGPRKTVFSTLAKTADRKEDRRIKQDTRSILIVLFTPREVRIKVLKQRRLTSNQKFSSRTSSISVESSYHQSEIFTKVAHLVLHVEF